MKVYSGMVLRRSVHHTMIGAGLSLLSESTGLTFLGARIRDWLSWNSGILHVHL